MTKIRSCNAALALAGLGWRIVPLIPGEKRPYIKTGKEHGDAASTDSAVLDGWWEMFPDAAIGVVTGPISGLVVIDVDLKGDGAKTLAALESEHGDLPKTITSISGSGGKQLVFQYPVGRNIRNSAGKIGSGVDIRGAGGLFVAPPSIHKNGKPYQWDAGCAPGAIALAELPQAWIDLLVTRKKAQSGAAPEPRSLLSHLLEKPPAAEDGAGRNSWLTQVAGHEALLHKHEDAYIASIRAHGRGVGLDDAEIDKTANSIWASEQAKTAAPVEGEPWRVLKVSLESGWLMSGGDHISVQIRERDADGEYQLALAEWLNADLHAIGVVVSDTKRTYHVEILQGDKTRTTALTSDMIGTRPALDKWLAGLGLSLAQPDNMMPRGMSTSARLTAYLEAQNPPEFAEVDALGWHEESEAFITHEGIIRADGAHPYETVRPAERLKGWAPFRYGFEGAEYEAVNVLREVLTFHESRVTAVHGSWWSACLLKPQIAKEFSQFPFMALEAPSESGKSTGYMPLITELSGDARGKGRLTYASLRDAISAHRSGIVWVDDMDSITSISELIRGATVEGSVTKKGLNQADQVAIQLHAALCISGESLGLRDQKALLDRCVSLAVPSPVGRISYHGNYTQYQDIIVLKERYSDLTVFAGTLVSKALALSDDIPAKALDLRVGAGRLMDKLTVIRLGCWILRELVGRDSSEWIEREVEEWISDQLEGYDSTENTLTLKLIPEAITRLGKPTRPMGPDTARAKVASPVFVTEGGEMWFSPKLLAAWWADLKHDKIINRTESENAIEQQAHALGLGGKRGSLTDPYAMRARVRFTTSSDMAVYWRVPKELAEAIAERAEGAR